MKKAKTMSKKTTKFIAVIEFKDEHDEVIEVELSKPEEELTFDEVEDAVQTTVDKRYGYNLDYCIENDDWPYTIEEIRVIAEDGIWRAVSESDEDTIEKLKADREEKKFLVMPDAHYSLTPEYRMYLDLVKCGIISESTPFEDVRDDLAETAASILK